jgi:hypothetical protein
MTRASRSRGMPRRSTRPAASTANRTRWILLATAAGLVLVAAVVAVLLAAGSSGPAEPAAQPVVVTGQPLPELPASGSDPAVGQAVPSLSGTGLDGEPMRIGPDQGAAMIVILAHWCPHCQAEVPELVDLIDSGQVPDGVSVVGLSTAIDELRPNYPPSAWLEREGWQQPTLIDDAASDGLRALGLAAFPGFVLVDEQGRVAQRTTGPVDQQVLVQELDSLAGG